MGERTDIRGWYLPGYRESSYNDLVNNNFRDIEQLTKGFSRDGSRWSGTHIEVDSLSISETPSDDDDVARWGDLQSVSREISQHKNQTNNPHQVRIEDLNTDTLINDHLSYDVHSQPQPPQEHSHSEYVESGSDATVNSLELQSAPSSDSHAIRGKDVMENIPDEIRKIRVTEDPDADPTQADGELVIRI